MTVSKFIPQIYSQKLGKNLDNTGVMMQCVNHNWEGEIKSKGDLVKIITPGDIDVRKYAGTVVTDKPTSTDQTFQITQADYFSFEVSKIEEAQSQTDLISTYTDRAKVAIELNRDSYLLSKVADAHADNTIATSVLTKYTIYDDFVEMYEKLGSSNALNEKNKPWVIIDYALRSLIVKAPEFIQATSAGDNVIRKGALGDFAGFDVLVCTNFSATAGTYNVMFGTNDAITYASQVVDMEKNKKDFKTTVQGLYVYDAKVVLPKALGKRVFTLS